MTLVGKVFAERRPVAMGKKSIAASEQIAIPEIACTEFGTLPRKEIIRLSLRHVYTMPVVLKDKSRVLVDVYQAEVFENKQWRTVYVQESADGADKG